MVRTSISNFIVCVLCDIQTNILTKSIFNIDEDVFALSKLFFLLQIENACKRSIKFHAL